MTEQQVMSEVVAGEPLDAAGQETPVGQQLRLAREQNGISLDDLAQTLKLGKKQLQSLESGDWDKLPGPTFIRGFVRNYARLVHIDAEHLMTQLDRALVKPASNLEVPISRPVNVQYSGFAASHKSRQIVLLGAAFVALAATLYFFMPNDLTSLRSNIQSMLNTAAQKEVLSSDSAKPAKAESEPVFPPGMNAQQVMNPQVLAPAEVAPVPAVGSDEKTATVAPVVPAVAPLASPQIRLVAEKESWVEIRNRDGKVIYSQRMVPGSDQALAGDGPLSLVIGFAPGVRLFWHGQQVDLTPHARGDVARLVLE